MATTANELVSRAKYWVGFNENNGGHEFIIDLYNSNRFLSCGFKMKYTGEWCAAFISACAIRCNATDIIPVECHCNHMISSFKNLGVWIEDESIIPETGDIIFYDWQDDGSGDNIGSSDHVGIVEKIDLNSNEITIIEGNYEKSVKRRILELNNKYIRGFARPDYIHENTSNADMTMIKLKSLLNIARILVGRVYKKMNSTNRKEVV